MRLHPSHRLLAVAALVTVVLAAGCHDSTEGSPQPSLTPSEIIGEWQRTAETLPPVNLVIAAKETQLVARLRLSGVEANGVVRIEGRTLHVDFDDARAPLTGELTADGHLLVRLAPAGEAYVLSQKR